MHTNDPNPVESTDTQPDTPPREDCWCIDYDLPCFEHYQPEAQ